VAERTLCRVADARKPRTMLSCSTTAREQARTSTFARCDSARIASTQKRAMLLERHWYRADPWPSAMRILSGTYEMAVG